MAALQSYAGPISGRDLDIKAEDDLAKHTDKYDFKSENVIELLKTLKLMFQDKLTECNTEETNSVNSYELAKQASEAAEKAAKKSLGKKKIMRTAATIKKGEAEGDLKDTKDDNTADTKSLEDTESSCATKKSEYEARTSVQSGEIEALDVAVKILAKVTGVRTADTQGDNPVPPPSPVKLLFLQLEAKQSDDPQTKAINLIRETAKEFQSKALERLAQEVSSHLRPTGPFDQVVNMIQKMVFRLMDEQKKEDEHKLWCDQEIEKTMAMDDDKTDKIAELKAEIKVQNSKVNALVDDIKDANKMISDIVAFVKEATEIRETGKKENAISVKDAEDAQTALSNAMAVLTEFYKSSGEVPKEEWEFIQKGSKEPIKLEGKPATWDSSYTGVADPDKQPGGILTLMEKCSSDFAEMEADTKAEEESDQKKYDQQMKDNDIEKARRTKEVEMKTQEKARRVDKITSLEASKKNTEAELEKVEQYRDDLKPACDNGDSSYDDRKAARAKEIKALGKAQEMLQTAFDEKGSSRRLFLQKQQSISRH